MMRADWPRLLRRAPRPEPRTEQPCDRCDELTRNTWGACDDCTAEAMTKPTRPTEQEPDR